LRNPIYFTFLVIAAAGAAVTVQLGMTGPVTAVIRGVFNEVVKTVNDQLRGKLCSSSSGAFRVPADSSEWRRRSVLCGPVGRRARAEAAGAGAGGGG
jgi:hypothetical protein